MLPVNSTEEFVLSVCRRTFLSLWCDSNPRGKDASDELCDILVVCDPHVIIVSVKDVKLKRKKGLAVEHERWKRKAIDESVKQIYGAERYLARATQVTRRDGSPGLTLSPLATRKVHRIAVAFGSEGEILIGSGDFGKGHVHVMTEDGFLDVLSELDTITDLTDYLAAAEESSANGCKKLVVGSEADLLACYLMNNRSFPNDADLMLVDDTHWAGLRESAEYNRKKEAEKDSYYWDKLIEVYIGSNGELRGEPTPHFQGVERALRTMAREPRFNRRLIGTGMVQFFEKAAGGGTKSRTVQSPSGMLYVFVFFESDASLAERQNGIGSRCFLARHTFGKGDAVIGIGFAEKELVSVRVSCSGIGAGTRPLPPVTCRYSRLEPTLGYIEPCEIAYLDTSDWSAEDDANAAEMKAKSNYEGRLTRRQVTEEEYPKECDRS